MTAAAAASSEPCCANCGRAAVVLVVLTHVHRDGTRAEARVCPRCYLTPKPATLADVRQPKPARRRGR